MFNLPGESIAIYLYNLGIYGLALAHLLGLI